MDDGVFLLDSEIARLVYGHLKHLKCDKVAEKFLHMSPHMKECLQVKNKNRTFLTKAYDMTLEEIINQFVSMNELLLNNVNKEITNSDKKFHDCIAALKYVVEPNKSYISEKDKDSEFVSHIKQKLSTSDDETTSDICLNIRLSPENSENSKLVKHPKILNLYYAESIGAESDYTYENNDPDDEILSTRNLARAKFTKKVKVLKPRKSFPVVGKTMHRSFPLDEPEHNFDEVNETSVPENEENSKEEIDNVNLKSSFNDRPNSESLISSCDASNKPFVVNDPLSTPNLNPNNSKNQVKFNSPNTSTKICVPTSTRQLRSSSTKTAEEFSNVSTKTCRPLRSRKKSSVSSHDESTSDSKQKVPVVDTDPSVDFALIHQKLIETPQLHARLAENINKMINESPRKKSNSALSRELDLTVQKVADETVNDPLCQEIINELLACVPNINLLEDDETEKRDVNGTTNTHNNQEKEPSVPENIVYNTPVEVDTDDRNSKYHEMQEFVRFNNNQQQSDVIIVEVPQDKQNTCSEHDYIVDNQNNLISTNSIAMTNIRSYVMCPSDITGTSNGEGNVVNLYTEQKQEEIIQLHGLDNNSYLIGQNIPLIIGNNSKIMFGERKTRTKYQPLNTSTRSRKYTPIAPKPHLEENAVTLVNDKTSDISKQRNRQVKKMKR